MNNKEKLEVVKHIKLGTDEVLYYPYNNGQEPLPLRPISSYEFDQCLYKALEYAPNKVSNLVIDLKLKLIDSKREIDVSDKGYAQLNKFYDSIDYWVVYYAMKDFQDDWFLEPDYLTEDVHPKGFYQVLKMKDVHDISSFVLNTSYQKREVIEEVFVDESGREVAYLYFYLNIPLSDIKNMTKLQRDYLIYAKGQMKKISLGKQKEAGYIISGQKMTVKDFLDKMGVDY